MTRREEIVNEMARLRAEMEQLDAAKRDENVDGLIKKLIDLGFTNNQESKWHLSEDSYSLKLDDSIHYNVDLTDWSVFIEDLISEAVIYDSYFSSINDLMEELDNLPDIYLVKKCELAIKYDDGDLDNFEVLKKYNLGS